MLCGEIRALYRKHFAGQIVEVGGREGRIFGIKLALHLFTSIYRVNQNYLCVMETCQSCWMLNNLVSVNYLSLRDDLIWV